MPISKTKTIKSIEISEDQKVGGFVGFKEAPVDETPVKFLSGVGKSSLTDFSGSVKNSATQRVGLQSRKTKSSTITLNIQDNSLKQRKNNRISIVGQKRSRYDTKSVIDSGRQGINVRNDNQRVMGLTPYVSVNNKRSFDSQGRADDRAEVFNFGQINLFETYDKENKRLFPFVDFPGRIDPATYLQMQSDYHAYMIINNNVKDVPQYVDPSNLRLDSAIDVFEVRSNRTNFSISDVKTKGIRASLSCGGWETLGHPSTKGAVIVDNKFEFRQSSYDYFEDSNDALFVDSTFPQKGQNSSSGFTFSIDGIISDGKYLLSPFRDVNPNDSDYSLLNSGEKDTLLNSSNRDISEVGERFKSSNCGLIFGESNALGTDSIAFGGFLK